MVVCSNRTDPEHSKTPICQTISSKCVAFANEVTADPQSRVVGTLSLGVGYMTALEGMYHALFKDAIAHFAGIQLGDVSVLFRRPDGDAAEIMTEVWV
jgi:hypothetical protein